MIYLLLAAELTCVPEAAAVAAAQSEFDQVRSELFALNRYLESSAALS